MNFNHKPVLLEETIEGLDIKKDGIYVDCTVGGGGHSKEILKKLSNHGRLIAIDQDKDAIETAKKNLKEFGNKVIFVHKNYSYLDDILLNLNIDKVDGILMDIGVSSYQLDEASRGFSYHQDAPLDMRMDQSSQIDAKYIVNNYSQQALEYIFWNYGEEKWGRRIAEFIIEERNNEPIETTLDLVEIIKKAIPKKVRSQGKHPARKIFQALRIEVNKELDVLKNTIEVAVNHLKVDGRLAIITFHSLEDRIVKNLYRDLASGCSCPPDFPICICEDKEKIKIVNRKPIEAGSKELEENSRSRTAKLRVCKKV